MKNTSNKTITPADFIKMLDYYFCSDYSKGDIMVNNTPFIKVNRNREGNIYLGLSYVVKGKRGDFHANVSLKNMMGSTINGEPFHRYKLIQQFDTPGIDKDANYSGHFEITKVTAVQNIITGEDKVYPLRSYSAFKEISEKTNQFQNVTHEDLSTLYNSGLNPKVNVNIYYKSLDFFSFDRLYQESAPFSRKYNPPIEKKNFVRVSGDFLSTRQKTYFAEIQKITG